MIPLTTRCGERDTTGFRGHWVGGKWEGRGRYRAARGGIVGYGNRVEDGQSGSKRCPLACAGISGCRLIVLGSWVRVPPALPRLDIQPDRRNGRFWRGVCRV